MFICKKGKITIKIKIIIIIIIIIMIKIKQTITLEKMGVNDVIDQEFTASLKKKASSLFRQISTSALPTLTAVTLMRCVVIHRRKMSDWSSSDHVTLPNLKWRQYPHTLFIPVEGRLIAA